MLHLVCIHISSSRSEIKYFVWWRCYILMIFWTLSLSLTSTKWRACSQANKDYLTSTTMKWILMLCTSCKTSYKDSNPPVLAGNLPFSLNISGFPFSPNILPVFETLTSQRMIMFSLFNQSCHFLVVSQPFLPFWPEQESVIGTNRP